MLSVPIFTLGMGQSSRRHDMNIRRSRVEGGYARLDLPLRALQTLGNGEFSYE